MKEPILGQAFNDILNELHAHAFSGVPGESDPFTLSILEREYIAYVLACYYQCDHCQRSHARSIEAEQRQAAIPMPHWQTKMIDVTLLLRATKGGLSPQEWERWNFLWSNFQLRLDTYHRGLGAYIAYAIGIARRDTDLMDLSFAVISQLLPDPLLITKLIRDIDRVVIFMKAATSKNRTDPTIYHHLRSLRANE